MEVPVLLAVWLGMRQSEICGLKWSSVGMKNKTLIIKEARVRNINNDHIIKKTKTYSSTRTLKIPEYILKKLEILPKQGEYVTGLKNHNLYERLQTILRKNDLPVIQFHDLRHMNASIMLALNIPDKYAMERGGWSTNHTMKNIYQQIMVEEREMSTNSSIRDNLARFNRKTKRYSKSLLMLSISLDLFFNRNLALFNSF